MTKLSTTQAAHAVDLVKSSIDHVVAVSFPKSRSAAYSAAVNIAKQAANYAESDISGTLFHFASFGAEREQVALALSISRYLSGIKAVQFFAGGKLILERHRIESVLTCYLEACACTDSRAHCNKVVDNIFSDSDGISIDLDRSYIFPCAFLLQWGGARLHKKHPAGSVDQIQALGVRHGCDWCPNFKPNDFKSV